MGDVTVGIDIGTTSTKAMAVSGDGTVVAESRVPHEVIAGPTTLEHDAADAWRAGVEQAFGEVASGRKIEAVSFAAMVPSLTAVDGDGVPYAPGLMYGDHRGGGAGTENPSLSGESLGFLRHLAETVPDAAGYWPAQAVASHALCGRAVVDFATAFCASPMFDGNGWDKDVLGSAGARVDQMPDVVAELGPVGRVGGDGPLVGAGTVDALAAQYVAGADDAGDVLVVLGATLVAWLVVPDWVEVPGLWTVPHTAPGMYLVGGPSNAGGLFVDWAHSFWGGSGPGFGHSSAQSQGQNHPDRGDVPVWLPYLRGERVPLHRPDLRAALHNLHVGHDAAAVERAMYEASGFVLRRILELAVETTEVTPTRIVATGGGSRSQPWMQALADCTGLRVDRAKVADTTAYGTAFLARCAAGLETIPTEGRRWAATGSTVQPDDNWLEPCNERYKRFQELTGEQLG